jgi:hypothetical protein
MYIGNIGNIGNIFWRKHRWQRQIIYLPWSPLVKQQKIEMILSLLRLSINTVAGVIALNYTNENTALRLTA